MNARAFKTYADEQQEASVHLSSSIDLIILTYQRTLEHCRVAKRELAENRDPKEPVTKAIDLISDGLQSCLDLEKGGDVAKNLRDLYEWSVMELVRARITRKVQSVEAVENVLNDLLQGWLGLKQ
jgi:flagellar protein FliS